MTGTESGHQPKDKSATYSRAKMVDGAAQTSGERGLPFLLAPEQSKAKQRESDGLGGLVAWGMGSQAQTGEREHSQPRKGQQRPVRRELGAGRPSGQGASALIPVSKQASKQERESERERQRDLGTLSSFPSIQQSPS